MPRKQSSSSQERKSDSTTRGSSASRDSGSASTGHAASKTTSDHDKIRDWAEERGGVPALVQGAGDSEHAGRIRLEFPDAPNRRDEDLEEIDWDEFFEQFDDAGLAMVYEETTAEGEQSYFYKLIKREAAKRAGAGR